MAAPVWWPDWHWERALAARLLATAEALESWRTRLAREATEGDVDLRFMVFDCQVVRGRPSSSGEARGGLSSEDSTRQEETEQKIFRKVIVCEFLYK